MDISKKKNLCRQMLGPDLRTEHKQPTQGARKRDSTSTLGERLTDGNEKWKLPTKVNMILDCINRSIKCRTKKVMILLYTALVRPHL